LNKSGIFSNHLRISWEIVVMDKYQKGENPAPAPKKWLLNQEIVESND